MKPQDLSSPVDVAPVAESPARSLSFPATDDFAILTKPYLLVTHIPYYQEENGAVWLEQSWHHDLVEHFSYLKNFLLCAPRLPKAGNLDLVRLDVPKTVRLRLVPLPPNTSRLRAVGMLPLALIALWKAVGEAEIVHTSVGGWPYPLGWIANPFAVLRRKRLLIVVESSWRFSKPNKTNWMFKLVDSFSVSMVRWSCKRADLSLFTHSSYRAALHTKGRGEAYVMPATWVNDEDILDAGAAHSLWEAKVAEPIRFLFAGRLVVNKGVDVLLAALRSIDARGVEICVDIMGSGEGRQACVIAATELKTVRLSVLDPVPYGKPFFDLVQRYHMLLIPSLSDEQPRIVFDANAQAVPVIASDTDGLRPHVAHGRTGWLVPRDDAVALATTIERAANSVADLRAMGMEALCATRGLTHRAMHRKRSRILKAHFDD
jgi:glycosyltransferase involved in cell wall biosynthesis